MFRTSTNNSGTMTLMPGGPGTQGATLAESFIYEYGQVIDAVYNEDSDANDKEGTSNTSNTGRIRVRFGRINRDEWAWPILPYQVVYPLVGEHVLVFKAKNSYWYLGPLNTSNRITQNASPIIDTKPKTQQETIRENITRRRGVLTRARPNTEKVGKKFKQLDVNPIKPFEGDVIYQGRYGQSIRFGSSQMVRSSGGEQFPNIILRAGQGPSTSLTTIDGGPAALTNESMNQDASSIYMVANQQLGLVPATFGTNIHLRSLSGKPVAFDGASILLNSDRLILNSKATSIFLFAKKGIHLNSLEDGFTVDTSGAITNRTTNAINLFSKLTLSIESKEDMLLSTKRDVSISGDRNITVYGNEIFLGGRSAKASPIAMASPLKKFLFELLRTLMSTSPLTLGPTGIINPALIARLLIVYSKYQVLPDPFNPLWASNDNFVMKTNEKTSAGDLPTDDTLKNISGIGTRNEQDAIKFTRNEADNAGLKNLRKLYDEELISKL